MTLSRQELEALLRTRKLDHTVSPLWPPAESDALAIDDAVRWTVPTGIADIDRQLQGGFPRGHLSQCIGSRSSGRLSVICSAMAHATDRGEAVVLIDPLDMFDPPSAAASGIDFRRMLWVRGQASSSARVSLSCDYGTLQKTLDSAVKALNLVLQAGGFGLVVLDLVEMAPQALRRLPFTTWLRLQRVIEASETACVLIGSDPIARSAGGVTLQVSKVSGALSSPHSSSISVRVIRAHGKESNADVCVPLSAAG